MERKKYTVLLLYPDYMTDAFGQETYLVHTLALNVPDALFIARMSATSSNNMSAKHGDDFYALFVTEGWHFDIKDRED